MSYRAQSDRQIHKQNPVCCRGVSAFIVLELVTLARRSISFFVKSVIRSEWHGVMSFIMSSSFARRRLALWEFAEKAARKTNK